MKNCIFAEEPFLTQCKHQDKKILFCNTKPSESLFPQAFPTCPTETPPWYFQPTPKLQPLQHPLATGKREQSSASQKLTPQKRDQLFIEVVSELPHRSDRRANATTQLTQWFRIVHLKALQKNQPKKPTDAITAFPHYSVNPFLQLL